MFHITMVIHLLLKSIDLTFSEVLLFVYSVLFTFIPFGEGMAKSLYYYEILLILS